MCFNCGCEMPEDNMGKGNLSKGGGSLVEDDFKHMAEKWGMSVEDSKRHVLKVLQKQVGNK